MSVALLVAASPTPAMAAMAAVTNAAVTNTTMKTAAPAEASVESAVEEYRIGEQAYALGNYEEAVEHFERSYALSNQPDLLFNIGQSYDRLYELSEDPKHLRKARTLFKNYIKFLAASGQLDDAARQDAEQHIQDIEKKLADAKHEIEESSGDPEGGGGEDPSPEEPAPEGPQEGAGGQDPGPGDGPPVDNGEGEQKPVYKKGWFWGTIVGVLAVAGGVTAAILLTRENGSIPDPELGTIGRSYGGGRTLGRGAASSLGPGGFTIAF